MNKLSERELVKLWYHSFIESEMSDIEKENFKNMCEENEVSSNVVMKEIFMDSLQDDYGDDLVRVILDIKDKYYDKVILMHMEGDEVIDDVTTSILEDCDEYDIDPSDVVILIELEHIINMEVM